jgi:Holliday junction resolvasome RuvABC endonuclease subunit
MKVYAIDQSLRGFAHMLLEDGKSIFSERIDTEGLTGFDRIESIMKKVEALLDAHKCDVIVMENYAFSAQTNNITKLAELGGCIKREIFKRGYATGRDAILRGTPVFFTQTQGQMKKFCLASGSMKKDSRYLLEVMERIKISFQNDDEADAYMHAWTASIVVGVIRGQVELSSLSGYQQESLLERAVKHRKGLSMTKALKLPEVEKRKLVLELEVGS